MRPIPPPGLFQVELTNFCNLNCAMCARSTGLNRPLGHMDIDLFREIVDQSYHHDMPIHWFHHFGEPLLYPHFREAMSYFRKHGHGRGAISTNALLLDDDKIEILVENCRYVLCCVDSSVPEFYAQIRNNNHHQRVCDNVSKFIAARNRRGADCQIVIQFLRTQFNKDENIKDLMELFGDHPKLKYIEKRTDKHPMGLDLTVFSNPEDHTGKRTCAKARGELCILWDGTCVPCCWDADGQQPIGNISQQPICKIWQGELHRDFQQKLAEAKFDDLPVCRLCSGPVIEADFSLIGLINTSAETWKKANARIVVAPGNQRMADLIKASKLRENNILAFCDKNLLMHGTSLDGIPVQPYEAIDTLQPDVIFIYSALYGTEIYNSLKRYQDKGIQVFQVAGPLD
jgi:sulfatase maturation enzyme AslB (radical SAM superfamily)